MTADGQLDGLNFNTLLRDRALPATTYVRGLDELGHSKEPDMFHDMFGHLPWLIDPDYRAFLAEFGAASLRLMHGPAMWVPSRRASSTNTDSLSVRWIS